MRPMLYIQCTPLAETPRPSNPQATPKQPLTPPLRCGTPDALPLRVPFARIDMNPIDLTLWATWLGFAAGVVSGAILGLGFAGDTFAGGYGSWPRRLMRLGHIAFFGIGLLNLSFAVTTLLPRWDAPPAWAAYSLASAIVLMPGVCFLAAWHKPLRHLFPLPVLAVLIGVGGMIYGRVMS